MPWRWYPKVNKVVRADGTVARYKSRCKKWLKLHKPYKPQKRGLEKPSLYSTRFGLLDLYNRKEQQQLICLLVTLYLRCFNMMRWMWLVYHRASRDGKLENMEKYAKSYLNNLQKDMGIKTTSFPHLGIYGDEFILNNKQGERVVYEDHSALKAKQEAYEKWEAENAKQIQEHVLTPEIEKGEKIESFADVSFNKKHEYGHEHEQEEGVDSEGYLIPDVLGT